MGWGDIYPINEVELILAKKGAETQARLRCRVRKSVKQFDTKMCNCNPVCKNEADKKNYTVSRIAVTHLCQKYSDSLLTPRQVS